MYSKTAKAAMHEIPWNAKPTFSSASVISADTSRRQKKNWKSRNLDNQER